MSQVAHQAGDYPGFCIMKRLGIFLLPQDGILVHRRGPCAQTMSLPLHFASTLQGRGFTFTLQFQDNN